VRDHDLASHLFDADLAPRREAVARMDQHHQFVGAERHRLQAAIGGREREHAEIDGAAEQLRGDLP
jgi:hypothetical protein